jgi:hypothetical protein
MSSGNLNLLLANSLSSKFQVTDNVSPLGVAKSLNYTSKAETYFESLIKVPVTEFPSNETGSFHLYPVIAPTVSSHKLIFF